MTVQEAKEILEYYEKQEWFFEKDQPAKNAFTMAIESMKELEQYRALGTPTQILERIGGLDVELGKYHCLGTVEELKEARELFAKTKIVGAENIIIIRKDGTYQVDGIDVLEAIQKQIPQTPSIEGDGYADGHLVYDTWICPNCEAYYEIDYDDYDYCPKCGQAINKSVMEGSEEDA